MIPSSDTSYIISSLHLYYYQYNSILLLQICSIQWWRRCFRSSVFPLCHKIHTGRAIVVLGRHLQSLTTFLLKMDKCLSSWQMPALLKKSSVPSLQIGSLSWFGLVIRGGRRWASWRWSSWLTFKVALVVNLFTGAGCVLSALVHLCILRVTPVCCGNWSELHPGLFFCRFLSLLKVWWQYYNRNLLQLSNFFFHGHLKKKKDLEILGWHTEKDASLFL